MAIVVFSVAGCNVHPIPQNVTRVPTDVIVASVRCEMRLGFFKQVAEIIKENEKYASVDYRELLDEKRRNQIISEDELVKNQKLAEILIKYGNSAVAYDFDFEITEEDGLSSDLSFKMPFVAPKVFDLSASGELTKKRTGKRTFRSQTTFHELIRTHDWCDKGYFGEGSEDLPFAKNIVYPVSGSIGMQEVVSTFMRLSEQGGGKDNFIDSLKFTTTVGGALTPSLTLKAVSDSFRLVSAKADLSGKRTDIHTVKVSLAFPGPRLTPAELEKLKQEAARLRYRTKMILNPGGYNAKWRARYNICVADARDREDKFQVLRNQPPEIYCIQYADTFMVFSAPTEGEKVIRQSFPRRERRDDGAQIQGFDKSRDPTESYRPSRTDRAVRIPSWWCPSCRR